MTPPHTTATTDHAQCFQHVELPTLLENSKLYEVSLVICKDAEWFFSHSEGFFERQTKYDAEFEEIKTALAEDDSFVAKISVLHEILGKLGAIKDSYSVEDLKFLRTHEEVAPNFFADDLFTLYVFMIQADLLDLGIKFLQHVIAGTIKAEYKMLKTKITYNQEWLDRFQKATPVDRLRLHLLIPCLFKVGDFITEPQKVLNICQSIKKSLKRNTGIWSVITPVRTALFLVFTCIASLLCYTFLYL